eukprot:1158336-Pelagomonas_calceolata.AAC.2
MQHRPLADVNLADINLVQTDIIRLLEGKCSSGAEIQAINAMAELEVFGIQPPGLVSETRMCPHNQLAQRLITPLFALMLKQPYILSRSSLTNESKEKVSCSCLRGQHS